MPCSLSKYHDANAQCLPRSALHLGDEPNNLAICYSWVFCHHASVAPRRHKLLVRLCPGGSTLNRATRLTPVEFFAQSC